MFSGSESLFSDLLLAELGSSIFIGFLLNINFFSGAEQFDVAIG